MSKMNEVQMTDSVKVEKLAAFAEEMVTWLVLESRSANAQNKWVK